MRTVSIVAITLIAVILAGLAISYVFLKSEGLSARKKPGDFEYAIANHALALSIPRAAKEAKNPIKPNPDFLIEAKKYYSDNCAICHANEGDGKTDTAKGLSPEVPDLHADHVQRMTDGEVFYVIRNGVRFTGMPGWGFRDDQIWKLVLLIRQFGNKNSSEHAKR